MRMIHHISIIASITSSTTLIGALLVMLAIDPAFVVSALRLISIIFIVGLTTALALALRWLSHRAQRAAILTLQHGQPVHLADLRALTSATAAQTLDQHYAIELARAERSMFPNLAHYAVRSEGGASPAPVLAGEVVTSDPAAPPAATTLPQLHAQGLITSGTLLTGFGEAGPLQIAMRTCGFIAVGGQSRSGKSTTVSLLVAQAALLGWEVALCDPFPHKPDGILSRCRPLSGGVFRQAGTPEEITRTIQLVDKIGQRRIQGDPWERPVLLVIEEFSNLVIRGLLPPEVLDLLPAMAMAYAAVGVHGVIIGHEFSRALLGERYGATLRRACTHRIAHRLAPDAAELLLPSATYARHVTALTPGQALFWGDDSPQRIRIPQVSAEDLAFAAKGRPPRPYAPWLSSAAIVTAPPAPAAPPSLDDRIIALLAAGGQRLDGNAISTQLGAELNQVRNALTRLTLAGRISRDGAPRRYLYAVS